MAILELVNPSAEVISAAVLRPEVRAAADRAHEALASLRFHEGLRRGWEAARAESAVREATSLAQVTGVKIDVDRLRNLSLQGSDTVPSDPGEALAVGIWRAQWSLASSAPPLNSRQGVPRSVRPLPLMVAGWHRDVCSALVASGFMDASRVAIPMVPAELAYGMDLLRLEIPALLRASAIAAHFRFRRVFEPSSEVVGATLARHLLIDNGVDPTGVAVVSAKDAIDPQSASAAMAGWAQASAEGVARWMVHFAQSVEYGAKLGEEVSLHVQAGILGH